jgi:hypothetical protein
MGSVLASLLWLPLGIFLSGNAALNFVLDAADAQFFWRFTTGLGVCIVIILVWTGIQDIIAWGLNKQN